MAFWATYSFGTKHVPVITAGIAFPYLSFSIYLILQVGLCAVS